MTIQEAKTLADNLMDMHGLKYDGWKFQFNSLKRAAGRCIYSKKTIELSYHFIPIRSDYNTRDTILHEIAHALVGPGHGHDKVWKATAESIGCRPERCFTDAKLPGKYVAVCPNGHVHYRHRMSRVVSSCGKCDKSFNEKYILHFHLPGATKY